MFNHDSGQLLQPSSLLFRTLQESNETMSDNTTFFEDLIDDIANITNSTNNNGTSADSFSDACEDLAKSNDAETLRNTMRLYGSLFLCILIAFCILRRRFPKVYNLRNYVEDIKTELADDARGSISWMWKLFGITDAEMMDQCGMDALCYARLLEFGMKLAIVGVLNAIWLIPVYATAKGSDVTDCISDWVLSISVAHLPLGSYRYVATVIGAYVVFGYTMHAILQEFVWFSRHRHRFLAKPLARNYCVYVQCIPPEYQSNRKLQRFFEQVSSKGSVLEANIAIKTPLLQKKVAEREKLVAKLEHAINIEEIQGRRLTTSLVGSGGDSLVQELMRQLTELNNEITESIYTIERTTKKPTHFSTRIPEDETLEEANISSDPLMTNNDYYGSTRDPESRDDPSKVSGLSVDASTASSQSSSNNPASLFTNGIKNSVMKATKSATTVANAAVALFDVQDGAPHSAAFVTFKSLRSAQAAQQMIQYAEPFAMEVMEAPQPEDVFWKNVGKTHKELQLGKLISFAATTALCLLWTIPMGFISTLSSIDGLRGEIQAIDDLLNDFPALVPAFEQMAPLLIVVANELLKVILEMLAGLEGPISGAVVQAKLFTKLSTFMIIQTFFVTAISGSIISELSAMIKDSGLIIELLAKELPTQSTFYMQILLVDTFLSMGIELLRVVPVATAGVRRLVGPRLTEKERQTTWNGLRPLNDPTEFEHANLLAGTVLYFTVFFVYVTLAPITTIFMLLCFAMMAAGYRHQFVYIYPTFPDSGGRLWVAFFKLLPVLMIIGEVTLVGLLALSQSAIASAMMFPLVVITILFTVYINQKHFAITEHLPATDALMADLQNNNMNFDFVQDEYIQPELREKEVWPENLTVEREIEDGCLSFGTPPASEAGDEEPEITL